MPSAAKPEAKLGGERLFPFLVACVGAGGGTGRLTFVNSWNQTRQHAVAWILAAFSWLRLGPLFRRRCTTSIPRLSSVTGTTVRHAPSHKASGGFSDQLSRWPALLARPPSSGPAHRSLLTTRNDQKECYELCVLQFAGIGIDDSVRHRGGRRQGRREEFDPHFDSGVSYQFAKSY